MHNIITCDLIVCRYRTTLYMHDCMHLDVIILLLYHFTTILFLQVS